MSAETQGTTCCVVGGGPAGMMLGYLLARSGVDVTVLARPLREGKLTESMLASVQKRREFPTRVTQFMQMNAHAIMDRVFKDDGPLHAPWQFKVAVRIPGIQSLFGRAVGIGVRPEHIAGARPAYMPRFWKLGAAFCVGVAGFALVLRSRRARIAADTGPMNRPSLTDPHHHASI